MKRFGSVVALAFFGTVLAGCESGLKEGLPSEIPKSAQTEQFKALMSKDGAKMKMRKPSKPASAPAKPGS